MKIDIYFMQDVPSGLFLFLGVTAGAGLSQVPVWLGPWTPTGVQMNLNPFEDLKACDDMRDRRWTFI